MVQYMRLNWSMMMVMLKYEVELQTDRGEAEVDIEARTGKVLEVEYDD